MIKVAITDDHAVIIEGIQSMLEMADTIQIIAGYTTREATQQGIRENPPDVLLLDINLGNANGIQLCKQLTKDYPTLKIIALTNYDDTTFVRQMIKNGAKGYLLKNTSKKDLITAIETVHKGALFLPKTIKDQLLKESLGQQSSTAFIPKLTRREKEVLRLVIAEYTTEEIASELFITKKTVEAHRSNLIQKLGVRNVAGLVRVAIEKGLVE